MAAPGGTARKSLVSRILLSRFVTGLARRTRDCVWLLHCDYNERGGEQRGPLLPVYQYVANAEDEDSPSPTPYGVVQTRNRS